MYLKSLTLKGFKSFASATHLNFEPGITCVVGPNGSGKSNVVDALSWVMGEQGAKSLRGGKMEDVIFAGTSGRAPLGRAEVAVTIDNTDGTLPIEYTEVTISRILFRNGQSEYQINGESARLLDIQELLSDSGIGREMHVIVGQGQLDAILLANPEERRAFIEEAAGVLKHRKRKEKALRKLDAMQANFARIQDLTVELRRQLKPLGKQAEVARKASLIQSDLRDSRLRLLADEILELRSSLDADLADENSLRFKRDAVEKELISVRSREEEIDRASASENPQLQEAQESYYSLTAHREKFRGLHNLASERARFLSEDFEEARSSGRDPETLDAEAAKLREEEKDLRSQLVLSRNELEALGKSLQALENELRQEESRISAAIRAVADQREGTARQEGHINSLRSRIETTNSEIARLEKARVEAQERLDGFQEEFGVLETQIASLDSFEPQLDSRFESAKSELAIAEGAVAELREKEAGLAKVRSGLEGRLQALRESREHKDGSERILSGDSGIAHRGRLADFITVEPGWEKAVAVALGTLGESVVVSDVKAAVSALTLLKSESAGQSEIFVVDGVSQLVVENNLPVGVNSLSDYAHSTELPEVVKLLLGGFVAADDLAQAQGIVLTHSRAVVITREGDLLSSSRARGGSVSSNSAIEINAMIAKSEAELATVTADTEKIKFEIVRAADLMNEKKSVYERILSELNESDAAISALTEQIAVAGQNVKSATAEFARLGASLQEAISQRTHHEEELEAATAQLSSVVEPEEPDHTHRDRLREQVENVRSSHVESRLALRSLEERVQTIASRAQSLENAAKHERENAIRAIARRQARATAAVTAQSIADTAYEALAQIESSIAAASAEREKLESSRSSREGEILALRGRARELSVELEQLTSSVHQDEMERTELRLRIEQLELRSVEEMGVDIETLINEYGPNNEVPTTIEDEEGNFISGNPIPYRRDQQEKRLAKAERDLAMLGKINPLALEEYTSLEERLKYLAEQLEDLKKTRKDLMDIVKEVDDKVEEIFKQAYLDTAREFESIFARLFPGGDGKLILTNPDDWNTTGVDVEARPPGKRVKRLSLLSGGERSLVAVAMLVAIFKARPSPFYVMDEVEAALDDTNLGRLLGVFEELREKSQLIVITHQKRTMEIADALYGVTMRGDGVSEVISQRLRESENA